MLTTALEVCWYARWGLLWSFDIITDASLVNDSGCACCAYASAVSVCPAADLWVRRRVLNCARDSTDRLTALIHELFPAQRSRDSVLTPYVCTASGSHDCVRCSEASSFRVARLSTRWRAGFTLVLCCQEPVVLTVSSTSRGSRRGPSGLLEQQRLDIRLLSS